MATRPLPPITRFAPSPTGHLHLGHVLHMWWVSACANEIHGQVLFRMEDHDLSRCRAAYSESIVQDIAWFRSLFRLSTGSDHKPCWYQSQRYDRYEEILTRLISSQKVYACDCSRQDILRATAQTSGELHYPGTCRSKKIPLATPDVTLRMILPDKTYRIQDLRHGWIEQNPSRVGGDVAVKDRAGNWTYQFCVVVDDLDQNIGLIVRGDDLLTSVGRQLAMREVIEPHLPIKSLTAPPKPLLFLHHPLLVDAEGKKLSKRKFSDSVATLRQQGWTALQVVAEVARQVGLTSGDEEFHKDNLADLVPTTVKEQLRAASAE